MTAVLVLQCRDDGLLGLDDPLGRFLPESGYRDATIRELLSHTSGMQAEPVGPWWERSPGVPVRDLVAANDGSGRVLEPRTAFHYSNLGFGLLGEVAARLRGESWWTLVLERLLGPLGMGRTAYDPEPPNATATIPQSGSNPSENTGSSGSASTTNSMYESVNVPPPENSAPKRPGRISPL